MKTLPIQHPTAEQLPIIQNTRPGFTIIRGAAGSGKTTTALLRIRQLVGFWVNRRSRMGTDQNVRVLVVTFNRTLRGYVANMATSQVAGEDGLTLKISTFSNLAIDLLGPTNILRDTDRNQKLGELSSKLGLPKDFIVDEVNYALGRFPKTEIEKYLTCERTGRGITPRISQNIRKHILNDVIRPYSIWKESSNLLDWEDLATLVTEIGSPPKYDIIVVDESQDLSANQVRGLLNLAADPSSITFILDAAQRIYPKGFTWSEVGMTVHARDTYRLENNHRNTVEICQFAKPLLTDMEVGDDGTFPNFKTCKRRGPKPVVLSGLYSGQLNYVVSRVLFKIDLAKESVAFLKPKGGKWFNTIKATLQRIPLPYVEITRLSDWPEGQENIALSTMSSAKGLEFDHVIILGLNADNTTKTREDGETHCDQLRRLLAMAITRARKTVTVGYKPIEASALMQYLDPLTYDKVHV